MSFGHSASPRFQRPFSLVGAMLAALGCGEDPRPLQRTACGTGAIDEHTLPAINVRTGTVRASVLLFGQRIHDEAREVGTLLFRERSTGATASVALIGGSLEGFRITLATGVYDVSFVPPSTCCEGQPVLGLPQIGGVIVRSFVVREGAQSLIADIRPRRYMLSLDSDEQSPTPATYVRCGDSLTPIAPVRQTIPLLALRTDECAIEQYSGLASTSGPRTPRFMRISRTPFAFADARDVATDVTTRRLTVVLNQSLAALQAAFDADVSFGLRRDDAHVEVPPAALDASTYALDLHTGRYDVDLVLRPRSSRAREAHIALARGVAMEQDATVAANITTAAIEGTLRLITEETPETIVAPHLRFTYADGSSIDVATSAQRDGWSYRSALLVGAAVVSLNTVTNPTASPRMLGTYGTIGSQNITHDERLDFDVEVSHASPRAIVNGRATYVGVEYSQATDADAALTSFGTLLVPGRYRVRLLRVPLAEPSPPLIPLPDTIAWREVDLPPSVDDSWTVDTVRVAGRVFINGVPVEQTATGEVRLSFETQDKQPLAVLPTRGGRFEFTLYRDPVVRVGVVARDRCKSSQGDGRQCGAVLVHGCDP